MRLDAELGEVWPRDGAIRVTGRFHGPPPLVSAAGERAWEVQAVPRADESDGRREQTLCYPLRVRAAAFEGTLPAPDLARPLRPGVARQVWDLHLTDGSTRLRLGRHLDDISPKRGIFVFPAQQVTGTDGTRCTVRPFYTIKDNLSVECRS